ncbi:hypothetical protein [Streptomyces endophyticus]|uniref:Uncharacterized protein n=1 Tax=Streptomyces endophyticus TaxID=714166 RepID=A0ABU6F5X8_9ACTN|nr:hypothetical protein [Streptomyces endophyticus]MEB8339428.1 hypothetical protein [Streptomyces endophyticus]
MATAEQVQEQLIQRISGVQRQGPGVPIEVLALRVPSVHPTLHVQVEVKVSEERWRVSLAYDGPDASLVSGDLTEGSMHTLELLVLTNLFDWWHTKDTERASTRMGRRLT